MSKGPGRVERAIEAAFRSNPAGYFSAVDLVQVVYPERFPSWRNRAQRVAVLRAGHKVAKRLHWVAFRSTARQRGSEVIFANGLNLRSYGLGQVRAMLGGDGVHKYIRGPDGKSVKGPWMASEERIADRLETDNYYMQRMTPPNGEYYRAVEYHTAVANCDTERAVELGAAIEKARHAELEAMTKALRGL